ncbi:uncharacterized protein LOC132748330 [Ruditapes philippinarum]|uniref:uncharacterized protein LOC132748330 n=1 Tax=Ruditapes philippinarum TaxID=129788 RepID=UPI00295AD9DB|nr:uncharacterized protein LOC132748330 [Ruditapes philippinarum]
MGVSLILLVLPARETGFAEATTYYLYSCPLRSGKSFLSSSSSSSSDSGSDCDSDSSSESGSGSSSDSSSSNCQSRRKRDIPYGIRHTYIQIGSICYDWGNWNYPRRSKCNCRELECCVQKKRLETFGHTSCAHRISEFESAWVDQGRRYRPYSWNCQVYTTKMMEFLNTCNVTATFE